MAGLPSVRASYARKERQAFCETVRSVGPKAPTLCEGWDVKDLVCHLLLRERSLLSAAGIAIPALSGLTDREMGRLKKQPFERLVERLRTNRLSVYALPPVDAAFNTFEFFVHHEDVRRAQEGWRRRNLRGDAVYTLWRALRAHGKALVRSAGVPVVARRSDTDQTTTLMPGSDPVELSGPVTELVLYLHGRDEVREIRFAGPEESVAKLRRSSLGTF